MYFLSLQSNLNYLAIYSSICSPGYAMNAQGNCVVCAAGSFSPTGASWYEFFPVTLCLINSTCFITTNLKINSNSEPPLYHLDFFIHFRAILCPSLTLCFSLKLSSQPCPAGSYASTSSAAKCTPCSGANYWSPPGASASSQCFILSATGCGT